MRGSLAKTYQKKLFAKKRKRAAFIALYIVAGAVLIFSGLSALSRMDSISIQSVVVKGTDREGAMAAEGVALNELAGNFLAFFSKSSVFLYPRDEIRDKVEALPFVQSVRVDRNGLHEIVITLEDRKEAARWCEGGLGHAGQCFSVDENGFIYGRVATSSAFIYRGAIAGEPLGQEIKKPEDFKKIQFFIRELGRLGLLPMDSEFTEDNYMTVGLLAGAKLIVRTDEDFSIVLSNISSILSDRKVVPSIQDFLASLDYMKLDSGNKVVYKLK